MLVRRPIGTTLITGIYIYLPNTLSPSTRGIYLTIAPIITIYLIVIVSAAYLPIILRAISRYIARCLLKKY